MVDRLRVPGELKEEFKVLGSTGNVGSLEMVSLLSFETDPNFGRSTQLRFSRLLVAIVRILQI